MGKVNDIRVNMKKMAKTFVKDIEEEIRKIFNDMGINKKI